MTCDPDLYSSPSLGNLALLPSLHRFTMRSLPCLLIRSLDMFPYSHHLFSHHHYLLHLRPLLPLPLSFQIVLVTNIATRELILHLHWSFPTYFWPLTNQVHHPHPAHTNKLTPINRHYPYPMIATCTQDRNMRTKWAAYPLLICNVFSISLLFSPDFHSPP